MIPCGLAGIKSVEATLMLYVTSPTFGVILHLLVNPSGLLVFLSQNHECSCTAMPWNLLLYRSYNPRYFRFGIPGGGTSVGIPLDAWTMSRTTDFDLPFVFPYRLGTG